jgi:hypothetical protein
MNSENIKAVTNQAIEQLTTALNEGRSETLTQYLAAIGRFHRYSLGNVMLIAPQKPTATHVAGFHSWHKLGRFVKKSNALSCDRLSSVPLFIGNLSSLNVPSF